MLERFRRLRLREGGPQAAATSDRVGLCWRPRAGLAVFIGAASNGVLSGSKTHIRHDLIIYAVLFRCTLGDTRNRIKWD